MNQLISKNKVNQMKEYFIERSQNLSGYGYPKIFKSRRIFLKLIFGVSLLISIGICSYLIVNSITIHLNYSTTSKIEFIHKIPMEFPQIDICNSNPFAGTLSSVRELIKNVDIAKSLDSTTRNLFDSFRNSTAQSLNTLSELNEYSNVGYYLNHILSKPDADEAYKKSFGLNQTEFIVSCKYLGKEC
jgi:hypothetical protein